MTRLQLLCTGTPAPLAHRGGSSYLVQTGDETLIFDCGPGVGAAHDRSGPRSALN